MSGTIADYVTDANRRMMLPGLQREYVWSEDQIVALFDSLIRNYPVGQVTLWKAEPENEFTTYRFIENHISSTGRFPRALQEEYGFQRTNERGDSESECGYLVVDGQQRINSIFIGFRGSLAVYSAGSSGSKTELSDWDERVLCINLLGADKGPREHIKPDGETKDDDEHIHLTGNYEFSFRSTGRLGGDSGEGLEVSYSEEEDENITKLWMPVSKFLKESGSPKDDYEVSSMASELVQNEPIHATEHQRRELEDIAKDVARIFNGTVIGYELPSTKDSYSSEDVHEIFKRINLNGSRPKAYQYVQSLLMSHCPYSEEGAFLPREKAAQFIGQLARDYPNFEDDIDTEFLTRCLVYLINRDLLQTTVETFEQDKEIEMIRRLWFNPGDAGLPHNQFETAVRKGFQTVQSLGFSASSLPSILPVALFAKFYYENPSAEVDDANKRAVFEFIAKVRLMGSLSGSQAREMAKFLSELHETHDGLEVFPGDEILKNLEEWLTRDHIQKAVEKTWDTTTSAQGTFRSKDVAALLGLLDAAYTEQTVGRLEVDHIFPQAKTEMVEAATGASVDMHRIGNLQLLEADVNRRKDSQTPGKWLDSLSSPEREKYRRINLYPENTGVSPEDYTRFVEAREGRIIDFLAEKYAGRNK